MNYSNNAIEVSRLTVTYNSKPVLDNVDLVLPRGKLTAIIGPNGAGKTTLVKAILGLIPKVDGEISFPEIDGKKPKIGYVHKVETYN
ncbi:MAG: ATP-binding cassette domain-containing protein, partial [Ruminiclostridium sp.]|nr:ATP-binding cassette domain-containing protein [Ruminiclostridium sp.]